MARARSPDSIEAEKMYCSGMKLVDIAKKLGKPDSTVRRWKCEQKWEASKKSKSERSEEKKANVRKRGAPKGNKNAEGAGAPKGNKNAEKHGAYSSVYWDSLDDDEIEFLNTIDYEEEFQLRRQIDLFSIRERRLLIRIKEYKESTINTNGLLVKRIMKEKGTEKGKITNMNKTELESAMNTIMLLEDELTKVQKAKTKSIDSLIRLRMENRKLSKAGKGSELIDDWIAGIMGELPELEEDDNECV